MSVTSLGGGGFDKQLWNKPCKIALHTRFFMWFDFVCGLLVE